MLPRKILKFMSSKMRVSAFWESCVNKWRRNMIRHLSDMPVNAKDYDCTPVCRTLLKPRRRSSAYSIWMCMSARGNSLSWPMHSLLYLSPGGALPSNRLMGMCRWMGSHFHDWIDYNGVAFSTELLEWGRIFLGFWGKNILEGREFGY